MWIGSYLKDREYKVIFRSASSEAFKTYSGVPQGSHLGPLLFVLAINDVELILNSSRLSIFADDMKIYKVISSLNDSISLQCDLENFSEWCLENHLELNVDKCQSITYSRKRLPSNRSYLLNGTVLTSVNIIKRFTRFALRHLGWADPIRLPPYVDRLKLLNLKTLELRRKVSDIVFLHQTLSGAIDCSALLEKTRLNINTRCLRSVPMFRTSSHRTDYGLNEPYSRMFASANSIAHKFDFHLGKDALKNYLYQDFTSRSI